MQDAPKVPMLVRIDPVLRGDLTLLAARWGLSRNQLVERTLQAVVMADHELVDAEVLRAVSNA